MKSLKGEILWGSYALIMTCMMFLSLQSCATTGYENVDTTRKAILVATAETRGANLLLQDLIRRNVIDTNSARETLSALRTSMESLQAGLNAIDINGDPFTAKTKLSSANASINIALSLLSNFAGDP